MKTKKLYILISNGGDGSYYNSYILDKSVLDKLQKAADEGLMYYDFGIITDGDGFHFDTINVPEDATEEILGISCLDHEYADQYFEIEK